MKAQREGCRGGGDESDEVQLDGKAVGHQSGAAGRHAAAGRVARSLRAGRLLLSWVMS